MKSDWNSISQWFSVCSAPAKHCLQAVGKEVEYHYFIVKGLVRMYYVTQEGKEANKSFYDEDNIVGNLTALILRQESRFYLETLEPSLLVRIDVRNHRQLRENSDIWYRMFSECCQLMLMRNERREAELLTMSSAERFRQFINNFPGGVDRIPQYHIASYLGITPVALSRYKSSWLSENS